MSTVTDLILAWYDKSARILPWRTNPQAYQVWVSEIMLQQTRVDTVLPYYQSFITRFPSITALAQADESEVLQAWEGLGYYQRARKLHQTARLLVADFDGKLPSTAEQLRKLPGVGPYTAAAIASIAFGRAEAAVDGNIARIYSRLTAFDEPIDSTSGKKALQVLASKALSHERPGDHNQALMDLGATLCLPPKPLCPSCPVQTECLAYAQGIQGDLPRSLPKTVIPHYLVSAAVIQSPDGKVFIAQRPRNGLLGGLWEFPGGKLEPTDADMSTCLRREIMEELNVRVEVELPFGIYKHAYTHYRISLHAFLCRLSAGEQIAMQDDRLWVNLEELSFYPMGKVDRLIAKNLQTPSSDKLR